MPIGQRADLEPGGTRGGHAPSFTITLLQAMYIGNVAIDEV